MARKACALRASHGLGDFLRPSGSKRAQLERAWLVAEMKVCGRMQKSNIEGEGYKEIKNIPHEEVFRGMQIL